jgi:hypothetical protein
MIELHDRAKFEANSRSPKEENRMILHTTEVKALPAYRPFLRFNNGATGEVDLRNELEGEIFAALKDPVQFASAYQHPVMKTVAWANGADLAPEFLLELLDAQQQRAA